jgi:hypothetical protein
MFLYRDEYYNEDTEKQGIVELIIGKQRNGPTGTIELLFFEGLQQIPSAGKEEEYLFERIFDPMNIQAKLNIIAQSESAKGQKVERGPFGTGIVKLENGEVHFFPSGRGIECVIYPYAPS